MRNVYTQVLRHNSLTTYSFERAITYDSLGSIGNGILPEPYVACNQLITIDSLQNRHNEGGKAYVAYCMTGDIEFEDHEKTKLSLYDKLESSWESGRTTCLEVL